MTSLLIATFIGEDGKNGYRTNQRYEIEKQFDGDLIWVRRSVTYDGDTPYQTEEAYEAEWKDAVEQ